MAKRKLIIKTNRPIGFIITDSKGRILKKGGPSKGLVKKNREEVAERKKKKK